MHRLKNNWTGEHIQLVSFVVNNLSFGKIHSMYESDFMQILGYFESL